MHTRGASEMPSATPQTVHRMVMYSAESARRVTRSLPAPVRATVRGVANWVDRRRAPASVEDWSKPLIDAMRTAASSRQDHVGTRDLLTGTATTPYGLGVVEPLGAGAPEAASADGAAEVRCLVVTALLDVGGMDEVV